MHMAVVIFIVILSINISPVIRFNTKLVWHWLLLALNFNGNFLLVLPLALSLESRL